MSVNSHFLFFSDLYTIKLADTNFTHAQTLDKISRHINYSLDDYPEFYYNYNSFDVLDQYAVKICYAEIDSAYFYFLVSIFPW